MTITSEKFAGQAPRAGQDITYRGKLHGKAIRVEGNLCWMNFNDGSEAAPFIWRFKDGLNNLHDWPTKDKSLEARS